MAQSTITVDGQSVTLVELPASPAPRSIEFSIHDAVAVQRSPFTGKTQTQQWPSAETLTATITYAPLTQRQLAPLRAFLMQMRGMSFATQIGDILNTHPLGSVLGTPLVDSGPGNPVGAQVLHTKGWPGEAVSLVAPGDWLQIGYRLHCNLEPVAAGSDGKATLKIWPSLREVPPNDLAIKTVRAKGLFRLAENERGWSGDYTQLSRLSIKFTEYR